MHYNVYLLSACQTSHSQLAVYGCFQNVQIGSCTEKFWLLATARCGMHPVQHQHLGPSAEELAENATAKFHVHLAAANMLAEGEHQQLGLLEKYLALGHVSIKLRSDLI